MRDAHDPRGADARRGRLPAGRRARGSSARTTSAGTGAGYPDGLGGEDIPLGARVFAVADTLDAMTSDRPYRKRALPWASAGAEILRQRGGQFDPAVVKAFSVRERRLRRIYDELSAVAA